MRGRGGRVGAGRYDFNEPERVPAALVGRCDFIMVDPPYLSADAVAVPLAPVPEASWSADGEGTCAGRVAGSASVSESI